MRVGLATSVKPRQHNISDANAKPHPNKSHPARKEKVWNHCAK